MANTKNRLLIMRSKNRAKLFLTPKIFICSIFQINFFFARCDRTSEPNFASLPLHHCVSAALGFARYKKVFFPIL